MTAGAAVAPAAARQRKAKVFAVAASILVILAAGVYSGATLFPKNSYTTPIGGVASVPLRDGSSVTLNTDSRIKVAISETERRRTRQRDARRPGSRQLVNRTSCFSWDCVLSGARPQRLFRYRFDGGFARRGHRDGRRRPRLTIRLEL